MQNEKNHTEAFSLEFGAMNNPGNPTLAEVKAIANQGFDYLELTMDPPHAHFTQIQRLRKELAKLLQATGLKLICHMPTFVSPADLTDSIRQASISETLRSLEVAATLDPLKVVLHPAFIGGMGVSVYEKARSRAMESMALVVDKATDLKIPLCVENMFPHARFGVEPDDFDTIFKQFPHTYLTLDTGHAHIGSPRGRRIRDFLTRWPDRIHHLHVSDNFGKEDHHLPLGSGSINFGRVIKLLKSSGYDQTVTFEIFSQDRDYVVISREKFKHLWDDL